MHSVVKAVVFAAILINAPGCSPRRLDAPPDLDAPPELIEAVKKEAYGLPKEFLMMGDGSERSYLMVVRQTASPQPGGSDDIRKNPVVGEWFYENMGPPPNAELVAMLKTLDTRGMIAVYFAPQEVSATNALIQVDISYGARGGNTRQWTFSKTEERWHLTKNEIGSIRD